MRYTEDRKGIVPFNDEHRCLKAAASAILKKCDFTPERVLFNEMFYIFKSDDVDLNNEGQLESIKLIYDGLSLIATTTLGVPLLELIGRVAVIFINDKSVWVEVHFKCDEDSRRKFFGQGYVYVNTFRKLLSAYSGRTGKFIALMVANS